jgi:hypothetical protein
MRRAEEKLHLRNPLLLPVKQEPGRPGYSEADEEPALPEYPSYRESLLLHWVDSFTFGEVDASRTKFTQNKMMRIDARESREENTVDDDVCFYYMTPTFREALVDALRVANSTKSEVIFTVWNCVQMAEPKDPKVILFEKMLRSSYQHKCIFAMSCPRGTTRREYAEKLAITAFKWRFWESTFRTFMLNKNSDMYQSS